MWLPGGSNGKESACNVGDPGLIPKSGRSLGEGNSRPFQYSCLENSMDRPCGRKESDMTEQLTQQTMINYCELPFCSFHFFPFTMVQRR